MQSEINMNKLVKSFVLVLLISLSFALTSCNKAKVDEPITIDNCNRSSVNAAEGFIQSVFTNDSDLFYAVFPEGAFSYLIEEGHDPFLEYRSGVDANFEYIGVSLTAENDFTVENGYDEDYIKTSISLMHNVNVSDIANVSLVKLRTYFNNPDRKDQAASDVYVVTYRIDNSWYVYETANSDADFSA